MRDNRLLWISGEYRVAAKLQNLGFDAEVLKKRRGPDIRVGDLYIDVKTGQFHQEDEYASASFGSGASIKDGRFSYCVFLVYKDYDTVDCFVFDRLKDRLEEIARKPRPPPFVRYENNPCLLLWYATLENYRREIELKDRLRIEERLNGNPRRFRNRWDKIVTGLRDTTK